MHVTLKNAIEMNAAPSPRLSFMEFLTKEEQGHDHTRLFQAFPLAIVPESLPFVTTIRSRNAGEGEG
jgi:hypothetical protein